MEILDYTTKSFILLGEKTKDNKEKLKELGGRYNPHLTHPETKEKISAWIFSLKNKEKIKAFVDGTPYVELEEVGTKPNPNPKTTKRVSNKKNDMMLDEDFVDPIERLGLKDNGHVDIKKKRNVKKVPSVVSSVTSKEKKSEIILTSEGIPEIQDIPGFSTIVPKVGMKVKYKQTQSEEEMILTIVSTQPENGYTFEFKASNDKVVLDFVMVGKEWKQVCVKSVEYLNFELV